MPRTVGEASFSRLRALYEVGEVLGTGATGMVLAATRRSDGREVAIKTLLPSCAQHTELARQLEREAVAGRQIHHPGIVPVFDQGRFQDGAPYVVFARLWGESLLSLLARVEKLPPPEAALIALRVSRVLAAVHGAGYVHRDVKPEHVVLARERSRLVLYLIDFGVCQPPESDGNDEARGRVFGTPGYLAPEQAAGDPVDGRSDLYGLGATLFEMLTGRPPFAGGNAVQVLQRVLSENAPRLDVSAGVPGDLCHVVNALLAKNPRIRFQNARALSRALGPLVGDAARAEQEVLEKLGRSPGTTANTPTQRLPEHAVQRILSAEG